MAKSPRVFPFNVVIVVLVGLLSYWNSFDASFHFDDFHNIVNNRIVKDLNYFLDTSKARDFYMYDSLKNRYVGYLSFALNYKINGLGVSGYHMANLAVHVLNALLLYLFVILTFRTPQLAGSRLGMHARKIALFSSLLFVSHPLQTQAVTYIVQRFVSLTTFFYMASLVLYVGWRLQIIKSPRSDSAIDAGNRWSCRFGLSSLIVKHKFLLYGSSILCALFAMKTKQIAFTLPIATTLYEFAFFRGNIKRRALYLIPLLLTLLVIPFSVVDLEKSMEEIMGEADNIPRTENISVHDYVLTELRVIVSYLRLFIFPLGQNLDHDYPVFHSFLEPEILLSFLFLLAYFTLGIYLFIMSGITNRGTEIKLLPAVRQSSRFIAFGIFWFFLTLSVESSIIPLYPIYEHRVYLPSIGLITALVSTVFLITMRSQKLFKGAVVFFVALTAVFAFAAHERNRVWLDEITLWEDVVKKSPRIARPHNNLCNAYLDRDMIDRGMQHCLTAVRLDPGMVHAQNNLGRAYISLGQSDLAITHIKEALRLQPSYVKAINNLAAAYIEKGNYDLALSELQKATAIEPDNAMAYYNLGIAYSEKGLDDLAIRNFEVALRYRPGYRKAHHRLGLALMKKGRFQEAQKHMKKAGG